MRRYIIYSIYHSIPCLCTWQSLLNRSLPLHTSNSLTDTIVRSFNLGQVQAITLKDLMMEAYANKGILKGDSSTWNLPAPTMSDIYELYAGKENSKIDSLYAHLKSYMKLKCLKQIPLKPFRCSI